MIAFENVYKTYPVGDFAGKSLRAALSQRAHRPGGIFTAVENVSFTIGAGESVGIVGGNGAGKSTLLKLLTRVTRPTSGRITVRGRISSLLEVGAGFHHDLNGRENIYLAGAILGMSRRHVQERLDDIITFSGLSDFLDRPVRTYSSGMFLRLAFSIGIHLNSEILVIDEAIAVGDAEFQRNCLEKIRAFRRSGGTLVLVSHVDRHLLDVCDRGVLMEKGKIVFDGTMPDTLNMYMNTLTN